MIRRTLPIFILVIAAAAILIFLLPGRGGDSSRENRFYPFDPQKIEAVDFVYPDRRLRIEYKGADWVLVAPVRDLTDRDVMLRIFGVLQSEPRPRMLAPSGDPAALGLIDPHFQLILHRGSQRDTLRYGRLDEESQRLFAQASWCDSLMLLPTILRTHFMRNRYDLSEKRPLILDRSRAIRSIQLKNSSGEIAFRPVDYGWEMIGIEVYPADFAMVKNLTSQLSKPAILDFLDEGGDGQLTIGLENPLASLAILLEGEVRAHELQIGPSFLELHLARNPSRQSAFLLDSLSVGTALLPMRAFLPATLFEILPGYVERLAGPGWSVEHRPGDARIWVDDKDRKREVREVSRMIAYLSEISTEQVESMLPRADQLRAWGLDPPISEIRCRERGRELTLQLGKTIQGRRFFRRADYPVIYSLPAENLDFTWSSDASPEH